MAMHDSKRKIGIEAALNEFEEMLEEAEEKRKEQEFLEKSKEHLEEITLRDRMLLTDMNCVGDQNFAMGRSE